MDPANTEHCPSPSDKLDVVSHIRVGLILARMEQAEASPQQMRAVQTHGRVEYDSTFKEASVQIPIHEAGQRRKRTPINRCFQPSSSLSHRQPQVFQACHGTIHPSHDIEPSASLSMSDGVLCWGAPGVVPMRRHPAAAFRQVENPRTD